MSNTKGCPYLMKRGKRKGMVCGIRSRYGITYCSAHQKSKEVTGVQNLKQDFNGFHTEVTNVICRYLYPNNIDMLFRMNKQFHDVVLENKKWLYANCLHLYPHSYGDIPLVFDISQYGYFRHIEVWCKDGVIHREGDLPACISTTERSTTREWMMHGVNHRAGRNYAIEGIRKQYWKFGCRVKKQDISLWDIIERRVDMKEMFSKAPTKSMSKRGHHYFITKYKDKMIQAQSNGQSYVSVII